MSETIEIPAAIKALSNDQLLALYNRWGTKPCRKFERRSCGEQRVARLLADLEMSVEEACAPPSEEGYAGYGWDASFPGKEEPQAPVEAPMTLEPGIYWIGKFEGVGTGSESEPKATWEDAANWLRAILETVHPEHSLGSLRDMLSNASPSYPFTMSDEKRTFSLFAVDETGASVEVKRIEPAPVEHRIVPESKGSKSKVARSEAKAGNEKLELTGKKAELFILLQRETGATVEEGCAALGWKKCGATLGRLMAAATEAGYQTRKAKDAESGKMRYYIS